MSLLTTSAAGVLLFALQLLFVQFLLRLLALKTAHTGFGQGLAAIIY